MYKAFTALCLFLFPFTAVQSSGCLFASVPPVTPSIYTTLQMTCEDDAGQVTVYVAELSPSEVLANWTIARTMAEQQPVSGAPWLFWWMNQPEP